VPGLPPDRRQRLLDQVEQTNRLTPDRREIPTAVARCAAVLMAMDDGHRLSAPTAVAQAEALMANPAAGEALVQVFEGAAELARVGAACLGPGSVHRVGLVRALRFLAAELQRVAAETEGAP